MTTDNLERTINIVRLTRWLVVVAVVFIFYWKPIYIIAKRLPKMLNRSESISVAGLSMKIKNQMTEKPTLIFNEAVHGLNAVQLIDVAGLELPKTFPYHYMCSESVYLDEYQFLEERGLIIIYEDDYIRRRSTFQKMYGYRATPLGLRSGKIMRDLINKFMDQLVQGNRGPENKKTK